MTGITRIIVVYYLNKGKVIYFLLDYEKTKARLREHFDDYNANLKTNQPDQYGKLSLKSAYLSTAETIINAFGGFLQDNRIQKLNPERPFIVVLQAISNRKKNHRCTIYRHLEFLEQSGIVLFRRNLGNRQGVEVKLNTKILVARNPLEEEEFTKLRAYKSIHTDVNLKIFLKQEISFDTNPKGYVAKYSTFERIEKNNLNTENKKSFPFGKSLEIDFSKNENIDDVPEFLKEKMINVLRAEKNNISPGRVSEFKVAGDDPMLAADIEQFTEAAWNFARKTLYPNNNFDSYQQALSKDRIREYFSLINYKTYNQKVTVYLQEFIQRILLARNFAGKRPERYIPVPWKYFDRHFEHGFRGTYSWLQKVKLQQNKNKNYHSGLTQVSYLLSRCLKHPEWKEKSENILIRHKNKQLLPLFRQCVEDFSRYNSNEFRKVYQEGFS
jgi:hypothetical protein